MDFDRQAIERRDFPIARRGYEPAAVDAHLRALASEIEQLQRESAQGGAESSLASKASAQVQSILAAAEAAAADIERQAREAAQATREAADRDAAQTRQDAVERAQAHVAAVAQATATLLERVNAMDREAGELVERLRAGAERLAGDLSALQANMGELYDAAAGKGVTRAVATDQAAQPSVPAPPVPSPPPVPPRATTTPPPLSPPETAAPDVHLDPEAPAPRERIASAAAAPAQPASAGEGGDLDSARLVALNMALNGESREEADRYLAENYQLPDRGKLIDEVYAAIER